MINADVPVGQYNSIANICLLTAEENQRIGSKRPRMYLGDLNHPGNSYSRKISRHLIPADDESGIWDKNLARGFRRFLEARTLLLCSELEKVAGMKLFRRDKQT